jgi:hypothetical protein
MRLLPHYMILKNNIILCVLLFIFVVFLVSWVPFSVCCEYRLHNGELKLLIPYAVSKQN